MNFRNSWWKFLLLFLGLYVILVGMLVPMKSGIVDLDKKIALAGEDYEINLLGYNSNYLSAENNFVWLRIDSSFAIKAEKVKAKSENSLSAVFKIPQFLPIDSLVASGTIIVDNKIDGTSVLPGIVYLEQNASSLVQGKAHWTKEKFKILDVAKGFKFPYRNILNETIRNTFFHVAIWFAMFYLLILALINSIQYLRTKSYTHDIYASSYTEVAILFGLIGIATGSIWAKYTWGAFWIADVKLNMSAIAILIYMAYTILRGSIQNIDDRARLSAAYNIFAFLMMIPLIFVIPRLTDSLHPGNGGNPALGGEDLDNRLRMVFYPAIIAWSILGYWISNILIRIKKLKEKIDS